MRESGCYPPRIARMLQNSQHERPEDVGYAVRALEVARPDCAVALQSVKIFALVAFKYPAQRLTLTRQILGTLLATLEMHADEEFVASACVETLKYLSAGSNDGRNRSEWPGQLASPVAAINQSRSFELSTARMMNEAGAEPLIQQAMHMHPHNEYLQRAAKQALSNITFGAAAFRVADIDGDGVLSQTELLAFQKLADANGDGEISLEEVENYGKNLLSAADIDGDGMIDSEELSFVASQMPRQRKYMGCGGRQAPRRGPVAKSQFEHFRN